MPGLMIFQGILLALSTIPTCLAFKYRKLSRVHRAFCIFVISGLLWASGQLAEDCILLFWPDLGNYTAALRVTFIGLCGLAPGSVYFAWCYTGKFKRYKSKWCTGALIGTVVFFYISVLTNEFHHLFYTDFSLETKVYGPISYAFMIVYHGMFVYTYVTLQRMKWDAETRSTWVLALCFGMPIIVHTFYMVMGDPAWDFVPLGYAVMAFGAYYIIYYHRPFNLMPLASKKVFDDMDYPIFITDGAGAILYRNRGAQHVAMPEPDTGMEHVEYSGRVYRPAVKQLYDGNSILALTDVTEHDDALKGLRAQNDALAGLQEKLAEQTETLKRYALTANEYAAEQRRVEIMSRLNDETHMMLEQLRKNTEQAISVPSRDGIEENIRLTVKGIETVRRIIDEYKRRA